GIRIVQRAIPDRSNRGMVGTVEFEIQVPPEFPEKYYRALVRSAEQCAVKKHLEQPPEFKIFTSVVETA
ncbi:MAG: osmotically inducible protein OsmC, partial [Anaerolineales bacterium]|nr:osmotically inducible protein OsmC [Anaerolineales bacterium]